MQAQACAGVLLDVLKSVTEEGVVTGSVNDPECPQSPYNAQLVYSVATQWRRKRLLAMSVPFLHTVGR